MAPATVFPDAHPGGSLRSSQFLLIAHRGGVLEGKFPDNSMAALQAALERGYRCIELDVRESRDGYAVMRHDADLRAHYGDERSVGQLTWAELQRLRSSDGRHGLLSFEEAIEACKNKAA